MKDHPYICRQSLRPHQGFTTIIGKNYINSPTIKWHISSFTPDMQKYKVILAFSYAFQVWQRYLDPIKVESTSKPEEANIIINFASNSDNRLPVQFEQGVLAYAYAPVNNKTDMWFNEEYDWGSMHSNDKIDLKKVAVHEIGHALNIGHTEVEQDIMYPTYNPTNDINITTDSIQAIQYLYGALKRSIGVDNSAKNNVYRLIRFWFIADKNLHVLNHTQVIMIANSLGIVADKSVAKNVLISKIYAYLDIQI